MARRAAPTSARALTRPTPQNPGGGGGAPAERGVDVSGVQRTDAPTRDVYVTRDDSGDREFAGFGLPSDQYCDCFIEAGQLPVASIQARPGAVQPHPPLDGVGRGGSTARCLQQGLACTAALPR
jgi:hypothetical protein